MSDTLGRLFRDTAERTPNKPAFYFKANSKYVSISWSEMARRVGATATWLASNGVKAGDRIAILSENRPEWAVMDLAAQTLGAVTVPIYPTLTPTEIRYILFDSGSSVIAVSGRTLFEKIPPIHRSLGALKTVIAFDTALSLSQDQLAIPLVLIKNLQNTPVRRELLDAAAAGVNTDSMASIIYTSGTTGEPKGVMLTHRNFIANVIASKNTLKMGPGDKHLSFLPLCHVFERMAGYYLMIYIGASIAYAENLDTVPQNLIEARPTFIFGVPRFYEKTKARVLDAVEKASSFRKGLFHWARALGAEKRLAGESGRSLGLFFHLQYALASVLVFKKFKARLGGRVRFCISGSAPLAKEICEFFCDLGVFIYEGYGLTETSPVISVNREGRCKFGSVGIPLDGVEVRLSESGEILTKSDCVMKGYYNKPEETAGALIDGWFHTGDLGSIDKEGFLSITGRIKELIVTSGGKKVAPRAIEELLESDPLIQRCVLFGEGKKFITALIVPRREKLEPMAKGNKISYQEYSDLLKNPAVSAIIEKRVTELSKDLANYEKIKYFALLENDFSQEAGELTPTLKVKREVVLGRYKDLLLHFYNEPRPQ